MKICFCLPGFSRVPEGGFKVVYEYANKLVSRGHEVSIVFAISDSFRGVPLPSSLKQTIGTRMISKMPSWFKLDMRRHIKT